MYAIRRLSLVVMVLCFALGSLLQAADDGYLDLIKKDENGKYNKHGWNHYGPGYFTLDRDTGVLTSNNGMGLLWFSEKQFKDFVLELDFKVDARDTNSGIFFRIPNVPVSNDYIYECFEIQIYDAALDNIEHTVHEGAKMSNPSAVHQTGAVYDAKGPDKLASNEIGEWNHYKITCQGLKIEIELNGVKVNEWMLQPSGKVATCWPKGYIGLQNHDANSHVYFKNIKIKELD